jgi:hypothetical protein
MVRDGLQLRRRVQRSLDPLHQFELSLPAGKDLLEWFRARIGPLVLSKPTMVNQSRSTIFVTELF